MNGSRGVISYYKIKNQQIQYQNQLSKIQKENHFFVNRTKRLQLNTIDLDYLDEQLRNKTGLVRNNELVIFFNE